MTTSSKAIPESQPVFGSIQRANTSAQPFDCSLPFAVLRQMAANSSVTTLLKF
jgi:hypothetical protein